MKKVIVSAIIALVGVIIIAIAINGGNILESGNNQSQQADNDNKGNEINEGINIIEGCSR